MPVQSHGRSLELRREHGQLDDAVLCLGDLGRDGRLEALLDGTALAAVARTRQVGDLLQVRCATSAI